MSSLVVGGGLLGAAVARMLARHGEQVVVFSSSFASELDALARPGEPPIRTVAGAIAPEPRLVELIAGADVVFYFAGGSTPASASANPGSVELSVVPATTVLELMRATSTRRIVLASSGGTVYGEPRVHPTGEDHPTEPIALHGHNALMIERYALFFARAYGLEPVILRIATAYGPGQRVRRGLGVVAAWIAAAHAGEPAHAFGSLRTRRDFVFADDVARAAVATATRAEPGIYNVGSGTSHELTDVIELLGELAGRELEVVSHPPRGVDVSHTELDCSRLRNEIGWSAITSLEAGLRSTWEWSVARRS